MLSLAFRTFEFLAYHLLIVVADRGSRLPRGSTPPEIMRLYRENLALKAQNGALLLELDAARASGRACRFGSQSASRGWRRFRWTARLSAGIASDSLALRREAARAPGQPSHRACKGRCRLPPGMPRAEGRESCREAA